MGTEFLIAPNLSFSYIVFVCLAVLCSIFIYNRMFSSLRARMLLFRKLLLLGIGWNFCSLITVLPNPINLREHFIDSPLLLNFAFMAQTLFWLPFGYFVYKTIVMAFGRQPSRWMSIYTLVGIILYWCIFVGSIFVTPFGFSAEYLGITSTIIAYFLLVIPPMLISGINVFLWGQEAWERQEKFYAMRVATIFFLFGALAIGQDIILPYVFDGGPNPLNFLKNTQIWAAIFLLALYQNLVPKIEYLQLRKLAYHVEHVVNDGVIAYNKNGLITFVNSSAALLLHLPEERIVKRSIQEIFPQINVFEPSYGVPFLMVVNNTSHSFQFSVVKEAYWQGSEHFIMIFSDVTTESSILRKYERFKEKMLQQQLTNQQQMLKVYEEGRNKERLLQTLIDNLPFRIAVKNHVGAYVLQNAPDKKVVGDLYGVTQMDADVDDAEKIAQQGKVGHYDRIEYVKGSNGEISLAEHFTYLPVPLADGEYYVIRLVRDMTQILKMETERNIFRLRETQKSRLEELGSLAGGIAHDFNNILGAQLGFCELAMATITEDGKTYKYLQEIEKACARAKTIVAQMLTDVRQLKQKEETQNQGSFRLAVLLQDLISQVRSTLPSNIVVVSGTSEANLALFGQEMDLFRVLQNLMNNGIFAMRESGGELRIFVERVILQEPLQEGFSQTIPPGAYARIDVSDSGCGIKGSELERIFSPFFTTKPPGEGFGLGLSSSITLVRKAHGEITVQSILGKGTTFSVYWPMVEHNEGE